MTDESMEDRLRRIEESVEQVSDTALRNDLEQQIDDLQAILRSQRFVEPDQVREKLTEVNSYVFLPQGTYAIDFDIVIGAQGVLEIQQGAKLYFRENGGVISYGKLHAVGTEKEPIIFDAVEGKWKNITIAGKVASDSVLEHCIISHGGGRRKIPQSKLFKICEYDNTIGGALLIVSADPTIKHCRIENNHALSYGGGLYLDKSNPRLTGNTISGNRANDGGGLYLGESNPCLEGNTISGNRAEYGGGLWLYESNPHLVSRNFIFFMRPTNTIKDNKPDNIKEL